MASVLRPTVNVTSGPSSTSVPLLVSQVCAVIRGPSCRAAPLQVAPTHEAHDQQQDHGAGKGHDDLADDRVADDHKFDVKQAGQEASQKRSQDSHDDVAEEA